MNFTSTPPTVPGAYWWRLDEASGQVLVEARSHGSSLWVVAIGENSGSTPETRGGLWSERLVPVGALKDAFTEALTKGFLDPRRHGKAYRESRTKQVVEGLV